MWGLEIERWNEKGSGNGFHGLFNRSFYGLFNELLHGLFNRSFYGLLHGLFNRSLHESPNTPFTDTFQRSPTPHFPFSPLSSFSLSNKAKTYTCVLLKSRSVPLLLGIVVVIPINPVRIPRLLVRPDAASLLRSQLHITSPSRHHSSHLRQHGGRLDLVCVLLVHRRNLRRKLAHLELVALRLAEADRVLLLLELQLHHLVRVREAPVACQLITPLTVGRWK